MSTDINKQYSRQNFNILAIAKYTLQINISNLSSDFSWRFFRVYLFN